MTVTLVAVSTIVHGLVDVVELDRDRRSYAVECSTAEKHCGAIRKSLC